MKDCPYDHVICPGCAHDFPAVSQESQDQINKLEAEILKLQAALKDRAWGKLIDGHALFAQGKTRQ